MSGSDNPPKPASGAKYAPAGSHESAKRAGPAEPMAISRLIRRQFESLQPRIQLLWSVAAVLVSFYPHLPLDIALSGRSRPVSDPKASKDRLKTKFAPKRSVSPASALEIWRQFEIPRRRQSAFAEVESKLSHNARQCCARALELAPPKEFAKPSKATESGSPFND